MDRLRKHWQNGNRFQATPLKTQCVLFLALALIFTCFSCGTLQSSIKHESLAQQISSPESLKDVNSSVSPADKGSSDKQSDVAAQEQKIDKKVVVQKAMKLQMPFTLVLSSQEPECKLDGAHVFT